MSAAGRDQRVSAAVASRAHRRARAAPRRAALQPHHPQPAADRAGRDLLQGRAARILETIEEAEAAVADVSRNPRGSLHVAAPLGIGKRLIAPLDPGVQGPLPRDRRPPAPLGPPVDITAEGLDMVFVLGAARGLRTCASARSPTAAACSAPRPPTSPPARCRAPARTSIDQRHDCLMHRYPGAREFVWTLLTPDGPRRFEVAGSLESDDGDVLTGWALAGRGIVAEAGLRDRRAPRLRRARAGRRGAPRPRTSASPASIPHKRLQDPKSRLFIDFMVAAVRKALADIPVPA